MDKNKTKVTKETQTTNETKQKKNKKLFIILGSVLGAGAIAGASVGIYFAVKPKTPQYKVFCKVDGITLSNYKATKGEDFATEIGIDETKLSSKTYLPDVLTKVVSGNRELAVNEYTYELKDDCKKADVKIPKSCIEGDITIDLATETPWYKDTDYLNGLEPSDVTKAGGEIQTLKVNGIEQKVRLIGVNEDYEDKEKTKPIHTTWEFVDLLSDSNGYSLVTYWNNVASADDSNDDYCNSSLRKALVNEGNGDLHWFQYFGESEDTEGTGKNRHFTTDENYANKSVLEMLPKKLQKTLVAPSKFINIYNSSGSSWEEQTIEDKLFLLSPFEMGKTDHTGEEEHTTTYSYYNGATDARRVKRQIKRQEGARTSALYGKDVDGECTAMWGKGVFAGYDPYDTWGSDSGSDYLLRSPFTSNSASSYFITGGQYSGQFGTGDANNAARPIVPAFCL